MVKCKRIWVNLRHLEYGIQVPQSHHSEESQKIIK